jgi:hypothetical protein
MWFRFEPFVVRGWPIDLVRIYDERFVYGPLNIDAKRLPLKLPGQKYFGEKDAYGRPQASDEAVFNMDW